jgi:acylphosphatase
VGEIASLHAVVSGRVQGVFFRAFVAEKARELGLKGFVRNLKDGRKVQVDAEGERDKLEKLLVYLRKGSPSAIVVDVKCKWSVSSGVYTGFSVLQ